MAREGVTAPIASATSVEQMKSFSTAAAIVLSAEDRGTLDRASAQEEEQRQGVRGID
jgi:aryl-alcohol dehydrogenase-like predicted oxidoreductase